MEGAWRALWMVIGRMASWVIWSVCLGALVPLIMLYCFEYFGRAKGAAPPSLTHLVAQGELFLIGAILLAGEVERMMGLRQGVRNALVGLSMIVVLVDVASWAGTMASRSVAQSIVADWGLASLLVSVVLGGIGAVVRKGTE